MENIFIVAHRIQLFSINKQKNEICIYHFLALFVENFYFCIVFELKY